MVMSVGMARKNFLAASSSSLQSMATQELGQIFFFFFGSFGTHFAHGKETDSESVLGLVFVSALSICLLCVTGN
ncbi:hypothetical protein L209DRAFT_222026 [Thermothelomyces heterothallicus CBS 203.75]